MADLIERLRAATMGFDWADLPDDALIPAVPLLRKAATSLSQEREAREKAEKALERQADEEDAAARAMAEVIQGLRNRATAAEASLAEAKQLLKPFADIYGRLAPEPGEEAAHPDNLSDESQALSFPKLGDLRAAVRFLSQEPNHER
jgi:ribosomal protein S12 methylthiotransferase accessory factor YcaO